jgi:hypothetical protein
MRNRWAGNRSIQLCFHGDKKPVSVDNDDDDDDDGGGGGGD